MLAVAAWAGVGEEVELMARIAMERVEVGQAIVYGSAYGPSLRWSDVAILRMSPTQFEPCVV